MVRSCSDKEKATVSPLWVAWILGKKKNNYRFRDCQKTYATVAVLEEVVEDEKVEQNIMSSIWK